VLLFPVSNAGGCVSTSDRKTADVAISSFQRLEKKSANVGMIKYVAALAVFLPHLERHPPLLETGR
jgi:hypothetical protein